MNCFYVLFTFGTEFVDFIPDLSLKITHPFKWSHQHLHGWHRSRACIFLRSTAQVWVPGRSLCGKIMWEQDFHSDMLVYTARWLLGLFLRLCFHFEILEPKLWCRQRESLVDCEGKTKATEPRSTRGGIGWHQGVWQLAWTAHPAVNGSKHKPDELLRLYLSCWQPNALSITAIWKLFLKWASHTTILLFVVDLGVISCLFAGTNSIHS